MKEPVWLDREDALGIHDMMLAHYGGASGLRDSGLLDSALSRPLNHHAHGETSLHALAALYAAGVVETILSSTARKGPDLCSPRYSWRSPAGSSPRTRNLWSR